MIAIIDYNAGNTRSVMNALERLKAEYILTADPKVIEQSDKIILPGVGHASAAMDQLNKAGLVQVIKEAKQPLLGICLGMQLLFEYSTEGETNCLGLLKGKIHKFDNIQIKVPQIGWNSISKQKNNILFENIKDESYFYLVHSYYAQICTDTIATASYGAEYTVAVQKDNFYGVQFHPEKSGDVGAQLLQNFINLKS